MNEITRIHLARTSYEIDVAAKKELEKYLIAVKKSLGDEIDAMEDIEIRMTEILASRGATKDSVITEPDIKAIKEQLGEPKNFSSDESSSNSKKSSKTSEDKETIAEKVNRTFSEKRFFRDTENSIIGGVIAGLSAYTGWDVTLLRLLAVILTFFTGGFLILVYIVAWICAPAAETTSEKLKMKGEPVNIDTIKESAKKVSEEAEQAAEKVAKSAERIADEFSAKSVTIGNALGRVLMIFCGIIGICVLFGLVIALVVASNTILYTVAITDIIAKPLLIVSISLAIAAAIFFIILGIIITVGLLTGTFKKSHRTGILSTFIIALILVAGATATSTSWLTITGPDNTRDTVNQIINESNNRWNWHFDH